MSRRGTVALAAAALASGLVATIVLHGCAGARLATYTDALADWRAGRHDAALTRARVEYDRWRDGNGLDEAEVRAAVDGARHALASGPIVPRRLPPAPDMAAAREPGALTATIRADLASGEVTAIFRAAVVVERLSLRRQAPNLLGVIFREAPIVADGALLDDASVALRSVASKRVALEALEALAR